MELRTEGLETQTAADSETEHLTAIAGRIASTVRETRHLKSFLEAPPHADMRAVEKILDDYLLAILVPGLRQHDVSNDTLQEYLRKHLETLRIKLIPTIQRNILHQRAVDSSRVTSSDGDPRHVATQMTDAFLDKIPDVIDAFDSDVQASFDGDPAAKSLTEILTCYPGMEAVAIHRYAHELHKLDVPLLPRTLNRIAHKRTAVDIHPGATIGRECFVDHATGLVVGETTIIGDNVRLYHGVTLGAKSLDPNIVDSLRNSDKQRHPTIESGAIIYPGATILGGRTVIGKNAIIGGNVFVTKSVPADHVVTWHEVGNGEFRQIMAHRDEIKTVLTGLDNGDAHT